MTKLLSLTIAAVVSFLVVISVRWVLGNHLALLGLVCLMVGACLGMSHVRCSPSGATRIEDEMEGKRNAMIRLSQQAA
jgi:hypothetical protein